MRPTQMPFIGRCTRAVPCQLCGAVGQCKVSESGDIAICKWTKNSDWHVKHKGYIHCISASKRIAAGFEGRCQACEPCGKGRVQDFADAFTHTQRRLGVEQRDEIARWFGIPKQALDQFPIGYDGYPKAVVIPAMLGQGIYGGMRHRRLDPSGKLATWLPAHGSRSFPMLRSTPVDPGIPLVVTEDPLDCFAVTGVGLSACSRWNRVLDRAAAETIIKHADDVQASEVIIAGSNDGSGDSLAATLESVCVLQTLNPTQQISIVMPPSHFMDPREWIRWGGTADDVLNSVMNPATITIP